MNHKVKYVMSFFPSQHLYIHKLCRVLDCMFTRKPTIALVYWALGCMTVGGLKEDVVERVTLMLHFDRTERNTVSVHTGASGQMTPGQENSQSNKTLTRLSRVKSAKCESSLKSASTNPEIHEIRCK